VDFRGPYADGPPEEALAVEIPSLDRFGPAELRRVAVIAIVLLVSVIRRLARRLLSGRRSGRSLVTTASEGLVDGFEHLGPTFVKVGQLIASSPGVFPPALADAALRTLDEVPPFDRETARRIVEEDLGAPIEEVFESFDDRPLAAASVGQVHACVLKDGRHAVVKLQRPDIRTRMTTDLRILHAVAKVLHRRTDLGRNANAVGLIEDLHANTCRELNPTLEAHRQHRYRELLAAFGDNGGVTVPEVHWAYCGPRVICMDRLRGVPLDDFDAIRGRGADGALILRRVVKAWLEACIVDGLFHGDVHAGNVWLLDDGRAAFLDFGIMGELDRPWRDLVRALFRSTAIDGDFTPLARAFKEVGAFPGDVGTDEEVGVRMQLVFGPVIAAPLLEVSLGTVLKNVVDLMDQYAGGAGTPRELLLIIKQLLYFERYAAELAPAWIIAKDLYLVRNLFPDEVQARVTEEGLTLPA
jgi:predicted unusual protein kinase regulating ubiquinone biosynthesis (AarF/ABC1/UbiB family)